MPFVNINSQQFMNDDTYDTWRTYQNWPTRSRGASRGLQQWQRPRSFQRGPVWRRSPRWRWSQRCPKQHCPAWQGRPPKAATGFVWWLFHKFYEPLNEVLITATWKHIYIYMYYYIYIVNFIPTCSPVIHLGDRFIHPSACSGRLLGWGQPKGV